MGKLFVLNGSESGQFFTLRDGAYFIGRSFDNDIRIGDKTVSRRHLKIVHKNSTHFITDLDTRNGTFFNGKSLDSGLEVEVQEGVPIAIGMTVICFGKGCAEQMRDVIDSIGLTEEISKQSGIYMVHGDKTNQRKLELIYKVTEVLTENLPLNATLAKILGYILNFLKRIDSAVFILVNPKGGKILKVVSKSNNPSADTKPVYCPDVVRKVLKDKKPLVISNVQTEKDEQLVGTLKAMKVESLMCIPLFSVSRIIGVIYFDSTEGPFKFESEDLSLFTDLGRKISLIIEKALLKSRLKRSPKR